MRNKKKFLINKKKTPEENFYVQLSVQCYSTILENKTKKKLNDITSNLIKT